MAAAAAFISWLAVREEGSPSSALSRPSPSPPAAATTIVSGKLGPVGVTAGGLRRLVSTLGQPVYWAGPMPGTRYELRRSEEGNVFLRYLPAGVSLGDSRSLLTVGTYPLQGAFAATRGLANEQGSLSRALPGGWVAAYRRAKPTSIYLARPGLDYQIEVFDPSSARARRLVESGRIRPVG